MPRLSHSAQESIPLYRPDLTRADEAALLSQLEKQPFRDEGLLLRWEAAWSGLWQRPAVAFADPGEAMGWLKIILGWHSGDVVGGDLLLDPVWREALDGVWLHLGVRDVDGRTGQAIGECVLPQEGGALRAVMVQHAFGLPAVLPEGPVMVLEEVSAVVRPLPGCGAGAVQMVNLTGPRMLSIGTGCVLLARDAELIAELARRRRRPPGGAACALGLAQWGAGLEWRLSRRRDLAGQYQAMRLRGVATGPERVPGERGWEQFVLTLRDATLKADLEAFLRRAAIGCGSPLWFRPRGEILPGMRQFMDHSLALPLYAALTDGQCKRIINRVHRWIGRVA